MNNVLDPSRAVPTMGRMSRVFQCISEATAAVSEAQTFRNVTTGQPRRFVESGDGGLMEITHDDPRYAKAPFEEDMLIDGRLLSGHEIGVPSL